MALKALFINFKDGETPESYFARLKPLFDNVEYIQRDDPKLKDSLKDTEVMFTKFGVVVDKEPVSKLQ